MSDHAAGIDAQTLQFGLLMESAQAHQQLAATHLETLKAHTQDLDGVVRDEIRRTLVDELRFVSLESERAAAALRAMKRAAHFRGIVWNVAVAIICTAIPVVVSCWVLPSTQTLRSLRAQRDALALSIAHLERLGGRADWRRCGDAARLCVRVDRKAPVYGKNADYYIVGGY